MTCTLQGLLSIMHTLDLSSNRLTGTLPTEFGNLQGSTVLSLFSNLLSGPIPSELGELDSRELPLETFTKWGERNISTISLSGNEFTGAVPSTLGSLGLLKRLELYNNSGLTGEIPTSLCGLQSWPEAGGGIQVDCEFVNCTCETCQCF